MIAGTAARDLLGQVTELATELRAEVTLRCVCRCRCHQPIGWATDTPALCYGVIDPERLDCPYACRGDRGCDIAAQAPLRRAHL